MGDPGVRAGGGGDPGRWRPCRLSPTRPRSSSARRSGWRSTPTTSGTRCASRGRSSRSSAPSTSGYAAAILEREGQISTYMGEGVAIPHGTDQARAFVRRTTLGFLQFPDGVDWDGETVYLCIPHRRERRRARRRAVGARRDPGRGGQRRGAARRDRRRRRPGAAEPAGTSRARRASMKVARFYAPGDIRIEDAPEPIAGPGRGQDPGPQLLDVRHGRQDLSAPATRTSTRRGSWATRSPARSSRSATTSGRRGRQGVGDRRPRPGHRRGPVRHVPRLPARLDDRSAPTRRRSATSTRAASPST